VPTFDEWKWFASSGRPSVRYPWGNDPGQAAEALTGLEGELFESSIDARRPNGSDLTGREHYFYARYLHAVKVGQFRPSLWGLHDLMGNASELTSNVEPYVRADGKNDGSYRVIIAGGGFVDKRWVEEGVNLKTYAIAADGQYSTYSSVRLVLLQRP
jgi:formylglycine-generating enzyme required for sulfatase activity